MNSLSIIFCLFVKCFFGVNTLFVLINVIVCEMQYLVQRRPVTSSDVQCTKVHESSKKTSCRIHHHHSKKGSGFGSVVSLKMPHGEKEAQSGRFFHPGGVEGLILHFDWVEKYDSGMMDRKLELN